MGLQKCHMVKKWSYGNKKKGHGLTKMPYGKKNGQLLIENGHMLIKNGHSERSEESTFNIILNSFYPFQKHF